MRATIPVAIQPGTKLLQLLYEIDTQSWILWLHHNLQMTNGTYLHLHKDGAITRITLRPDGTEDHYIVREGGVNVIVTRCNDN